MVKTTLLMIVLLLSMVIPSQANCSFGTREVTSLVFHDSGNLYVGFSGQYSHRENCQSKSTYVLPKKLPFFKEIYAGLLAAMHAKSKVCGWVNGCVTVWNNTKVKLTRIDFKPN